MDEINFELHDEELRIAVMNATQMFLLATKHRRHGLVAYYGKALEMLLSRALRENESRTLEWWVSKAPPSEAHDKLN